MSVRNQKIVMVEERVPRDTNHLYAMMNIDALSMATKLLKCESFKMWIYLNKNQDHFRLELSQKACEDWGIKKDSYYKSIKKLEELGYLCHSHGNVYRFYEFPYGENPIDSESRYGKSNFVDGEKWFMNVNTDRRDKKPKTADDLGF